MKLVRLRLRNFRQHADTEIVFRAGVTGIIGPNGAGKSTLLEAIAWAIYGAPAARGTNETIRFVRAETRSPVRVELELELGGHDYRVVRSLTGADVYRDGDPAPVATTVRGATEYLQRRLGMTREEFFNTYFTGQKELQFLGQMGPTERARFLARVLGYERLRLAQDRARTRKRELGHEIDGVRGGMRDPEALSEEREGAQARERDATAAVTAAARELTAAESRLAELAPRWEAALASQDRMRELEHRRELAAREYREAARMEAGAREELEAVAAAAQELTELGERLAPLQHLVRECERWRDLALAEERRAVLSETVEQLRTEVREGESRLARLEQAPAFVARFRSQLETARAELAEVEAAVERERDAWQQGRQEVRTRLMTYKDRTAELQQQLDQLREAGPQGTCPTCNRPLHDHFDQVLRDLEDEWESLIQDGKWLKKREAQLEAKPASLEGAEQGRVTIAERTARLADKLARSEQAAEEADKLRGDVARRRERLAAAERDLGSLPTGYDRALHGDAEERLEGLRAAQRRAARLEEAVSRKGRLEEERDAAAARREAAEGEGWSLRAELEALGFDPAGFDALRAGHEAAGEAVRGAALARTEAEGRLAAAREAVAAADRADAEQRARQATLDALVSEREHNAELDRALSRLRTELTGRVRPELSELASAFLSDVTAGRYTALELDPAYNVLVLEEGEEKPVISGGEADIASLVLRLAISQMIAERAGHPPGVLILDEVFGSLDVARRDQLVQLLHGLTGRFEQVVLISHIEDVRDGLDHVIRCTFDERSGASRVTEEAVSTVLAGV